MIIFIGIQGSGKSTFYHSYFSDMIHINLDTLRTRHREREAIKSCIEEDQSFIVDNTNPTKVDRQRYIPFAKEKGYKIIGYYFESKISDCISRNAKREGKARIPDKAIAFTYNRLELPDYKEGFDELYYVKITDEGFMIEEWKDEV